MLERAARLIYFRDARRAGAGIKLIERAEVTGSLVIRYILMRGRRDSLEDSVAGLATTIPRSEDNRGGMGTNFQP